MGEAIPKSGGIDLRGLKKRLAIIAILCIVFRASYALGADSALDTYIQAAFNEDGQVANTVISQSPLLMANRGTDEASEDQDVQAAGKTQETEAIDAQTETAEAGAESEVSQETTESENTDSNIKERTITTGSGDGYINADGIYVKNSTTYDINVEDSLNKEISVSLQAGDESPQVLIIHTHGSESYAPDGSYEESDSYRTQDTEHNVMKVGDELAAALEEKGISVIHDKNFYDYPSYMGSYGRSLTATEKYLQQYPSIKVVIDLHRDALMEDDGTVYKTVAEINDETCSQIMLVVGTDGTGLSHGNWSENFSLALKLQVSMNEKYPSLARPVNLREERFNQHLSSGALLVEVGTNGNTLQESITAVRYFADCLEDVLMR